VFISSGVCLFRRGCVNFFGGVSISSGVYLSQRGSVDLFLGVFNSSGRLCFLRNVFVCSGGCRFLRGCI